MFPLPNLSPTEWVGAIHTLIVWQVCDDEPFFGIVIEDYDLEHPVSCKMEPYPSGPDGETSLGYCCDVAYQENEYGLSDALDKSEITGPGTYRIQCWGRKYYVWDAWAWEYDGGISVCEDAMTSAMRARLHEWRLSGASDA